MSLDAQINQILMAFSPPSSTICRANQVRWRFGKLALRVTYSLAISSSPKVLKFLKSAAFRRAFLKVPSGNLLSLINIWVNIGRLFRSIHLGNTYMHGSRSITQFCVYFSSYFTTALARKPENLARVSWDASRTSFHWGFYIFTCRKWAIRGRETVDRGELAPSW